MDVFCLQYLIKMRLLNLCNCGVLLIIVCHLFTVEVFAVEIECEPIEKCSLAVNILSKRYIPAQPEVWRLFKISECGYDKESNRLKIWCPKFGNCRTPDNEFGTCMPLSSCAGLPSLLKINVAVELTVKLPLVKYICEQREHSQLHICCPWPMEGEIAHDPNFGKKNDADERQKRQTHNPWFAHSENGNNFFDDGENQFFQNNNGFGDIPDFGFESKKNSFAQQNTNFYDYLKSGQANSINKLHSSLQKQNRWFQGALQNNSKKFSEESRNFNNDLVNSWPWLPRRKNYTNSKYNLTEETSDLMQEICMTPEHSEGICKGIYQCPTFVEALSKVNTTDRIQTGYLKKFRCNGTTNRDVKVCCSENSIILPAHISRTIQPEAKNQENTLKSLESFSNICGREILDDKIIGGTVTGLAEFPWTAVLYYSSSKGLTFGCGGSVISDRYIVTAAHCVNSVILGQAGLQNLQKVVLGEYDRRNETDCIYTKYGSDCAAPSQSFGVDRIIEHELFKSDATPHDIALVRLKKNIIFSDFIRPVCLPSVGFSNIKKNESVTITGWGRTESGESSQVKRKARLTFISKDNCRQLGPLTDGQMCLGGGKGIDSCKGDSGGPVMTHTVRTSSDSVTTLVGIISFGFGTCGTTTSVSTYVPHYLEWILKNII